MITDLGCKMRWDQGGSALKISVRSKFLGLALVVVTAIGAIYFVRHLSPCALSTGRAREAMLKADLNVIRQAVDNYTVDKQQPPKTLQDLVDAHYLPEIPIDPCTCKKDWVLPKEDVVLSPDLRSAGIVDVHSNSNCLDRNGAAYSTW